MSSEPPSKGITPVCCAVVVLVFFLLVMQFLRAEMRSANSSSSLLSVPQFRALAFLDHHSGASLSELAEHLGVTRATGSAIIDRLVQRGLVDRTERPEERRHVMLKLTQAGSEYLQQIREKTQAEIAKMFVSQSEVQRLHVIKGLAILNKENEGKASELGS